MKRELLRFDIPYGVKNKLRHFINPFGSFFYFRKKNAVFVDRRGKTDIADSQHCKQIQVTDQVHWMSLNSPPLSWGQKALSLKGCVRQDTSRALAEAGFDKSATLEIICKILCNTA